jgi:hypothetical protein
LTADLRYHVPLMMKVRCPYCRKETTWEENPFRPFCSERCRLIDLGQWAAEEYRLAGERAGSSDFAGRQELFEPEHD